MPKFFDSKVAVLAALMLVLVLVLSLVSSVGRSLSLEADTAKLKERAAILKQTSDKIATSNAAVQANEQIERDARLRLGLQKPGESVIIIQDSRVAVGVPTATAVPTQLSNLAKWKNYFFQ